MRLNPIIGLKLNRIERQYQKRGVFLEYVLTSRPNHFLVVIIIEIAVQLLKNALLYIWLACGEIAPHGVG